MKRFVAVVLVLMLLAGFINAFADGIDLSGISDDELAVLLEQVKDEMIDRGIARSGVLQKGVYVVGKDIAAGTYVVSSHDPESSETIYYTLVPSQEIYDMYLEVDKAISASLGPDAFYAKNGYGRITLEDGQVLIVNVTPMKLEEDIANRLVP